VFNSPLLRLLTTLTFVGVFEWLMLADDHRFLEDVYHLSTRGRSMAHKTETSIESHSKHTFFIAFIN